MSFSRENITWKSKDGTWSRGMFATSWVGSESDGYDPEGDVEYDFSRFSWVTTGHPDEDAPMRAWHGANPGGGIDARDDDERIEELDRMAAECKERARREDAVFRRTAHWR